MKSHPLIPLVLLLTFSGVLVWGAGDDDSPPADARTIIPELALPARAAAPAATMPEPTAPAASVVDTAPWAHPDVMHELRTVEPEDAVALAAALERARPALATDQDVQLQVGAMLVSRGDPVDGLAWQLLACMDCTQVDERIGFGCAAAGLCDPNLALVDIFRRDFGEALTAAALARLEELRGAIASGDPLELAAFTELDPARFPPADAGECRQLRTPTPECPWSEIVRQTQ